MESYPRTATKSSPSPYRRLHQHHPSNRTSILPLSQFALEKSSTCDWETQTLYGGFVGYRVARC